MQAAAGLENITDQKLALARNLANEDHTIDDVLARADTIGLDATNDRLAESLFGQWDLVLRRCGSTLSLEAACALVQSMRQSRFDPEGAFTMLPPKEADALIEYSMETVDEMRAIDREHHAELDNYHAANCAKRLSNSQLELTALVKQYALALSFFDRWQKRGVASLQEAKEKLKEIDTNQQKLDFVREQIEMRTVGLGFEEFRTAWSSGKDENVGTLDDLLDALQLIIAEEKERAGDDSLPTCAVVPQMRRKTYKELGTPTPQAELLSAAKVPLSVDEKELLERAREQRQTLVEASELDKVADQQDGAAPPHATSLSSTRYWRSDGATGRR